MGKNTLDNNKVLTPIRTQFEYSTRIFRAELDFPDKKWKKLLASAQTTDKLKARSD